MGQVNCVKCGRLGDDITVPVWGGKMGEEIKAKVCAACWTNWTEHQTKFINEFRLNLRDASSRERLTKEMRLFLNLPAPVAG